MAEIGIGLIGLGVHGKRYAAHLLRGDIPGAGLVAVCRRDAKAGASFAAENGLAFYSDYRELAALKEVDAVAVVTPSPTHLEMCKASLEAGKPVIVEKPVLHTVAEGVELARSASSAGPPLMVAQTLRYNGVVRFLREHSELVGRPVRLRMAFRLPAARLFWESDRGGAPRGSILETGVHLFDAARWIIGEEPTRVFCTSDRIMSDRAEDFFSAELYFKESKTHCLVEVAKCSSARVEPVDLSGDGGHLIGDARSNKLTLFREDGSEPIGLGPPVHTVGAVLSEFISCLLRDRPVPITLEDGLRAVQVAEACFASARDGRYVDLPDGVWEEVEKG